MDWNRWRGLWRFVAYAVATLIPVVWIGLMLSHRFAAEVDAAALRVGELQSRVIAESAIEPFLQGQPLSVGLTREERDMFALSTGSLLGQDRVLLVRLFDLNGRVVFDAARPDSTAGSSIGDTGVQIAATRGLVSTLTTVDDLAGGQTAAGEGPAAIVSMISVHPVGQPERVVGSLKLRCPTNKSLLSVDCRWLACALRSSVAWAPSG